MASEEHLKILGQGIRAWNNWRRKNPTVIPDLTKINLESFNLNYIFGGKTKGFIGANLSKANLAGAQLYGMKLGQTNLSGATLNSANLVDARLWQVNLSGASLIEANLRGTKFDNVIVAGADFSRSDMAYTQIIRTDLRGAIGLDVVRHGAPSAIDVDTLYMSGGNIPLAFLSGVGVPDQLITYLPSLIGAEQAIQFYSCFISYSNNDDEFAKRLYSRMRDEHLRVWFAPEDVKGGEKLYEQIDRAIQCHDRLLLVLSECSLRSKWVETEIRQARKVEIEEQRRKLFPIRLVSYEKLRQWECFDSDTGEDLAREVRAYFIPDFSEWKHHDSFEKSFKKLRDDLKTTEIKTTNDKRSVS